MITYLLDIMMAMAKKWINCILYSLENMLYHSLRVSNKAKS